MRELGNTRAIILQVISLGIGTLGLSYLGKVKLSPGLVDAGHWQFLTNLSLVFLMMIFVLGLISHITRDHTIYRWKNTLHVFCFVVVAMVSLIYWPLRLFFLELLVKDVTKFSTPVVMDLSVHLMPALSLGLDYFLFMPNWTTPASTVFIGCLCITFSYWAWLLYLIDFDNGGTFPYMFLNVDSALVRSYIFVVVGLCAFGVFLVMRYLYNRFIDIEVKQR